MPKQSQLCRWFRDSLPRFSLANAEPSFGIEHVRCNDPFRLLYSIKIPALPTARTSKLRTWSSSLPLLTSPSLLARIFNPSSTVHVSSDALDPPRGRIELPQSHTTNQYSRPTILNLSLTSEQHSRSPSPRFQTSNRMTSLILIPYQRGKDLLLTPDASRGRGRSPVTSFRRWRGQPGRAGRGRQSGTGIMGTFGFLCTWITGAIHTPLTA